MHKLSFTIILTLIALFVQAQSPHGKSFQIDCAQCHSSSNWSVNRSGMLFNHDNTSFHLVGQHKSVNCKDCHTSLDFKDKRQSCVECHTDMHNSTLGKDCARCHSPNSWIIQNTTEMHQQSRFPLLGAHRTADCTNCHQSASSLQFEPLGIECNNCHQKDFQNATSPNHVLGGYSTNCIDCHSSGSVSWNTIITDHSFFPLTAGHTIGCTECHVSGTYGKLPTDCNSCHLKNHTAAQIPSHTAAGIPNDCATCHTSTTWKPSSFNHTTNTGYELKGGHKTLVQCSDCHKGNLTAASQECITCHQVQYDNAPRHKQSAFPTNCLMCHTQNNWLENNFNHATTGFPLTGAHATVLCASCHTTGFKGTPTACYSCHATKYNSTTNPNHLSAKFPTNCESCHSTNNWTPSTFNHDVQYFPIYSGKHRGKWNLCSECHTNAGNYATFSCILCHEHNNKTSVDNDHKDERGYSYTSAACYNCHPTGN